MKNSRAWEVSTVIYCDTKEEAIAELREDIKITNFKAKEVTEQ